MQTDIAIISLTFAGFSYCSPTSWQKNVNEVGGAYQFDVRFTDAIGDLIGGINKWSIEDFKSADVKSELPNFLVISIGGVDQDPVQFAYAGYRFSSSSGCSTGGYEDGNRDIDCGFNC